VAVVEMLPEILGGLDGEISACFREIYTKKGITFHLNAKVTQVDGHKVVFEKDGKNQKRSKVKRLLLMCWSSSVTPGFGLENLG
jgi:dihydrolipoamide dehydrogenase